MTWTTPTTRATGDLVTASIYNTDIVNNLIEVGGNRYRKTTAKTLNTSISETDLLNGEFTLAANDLGTNRVLKLYASGDWLQNSGSNQNMPRFKLKLGATTLLDTNVLTSPIAANSATRFPWAAKAEIHELGATNSQWATFVLEIGSLNGNSAITSASFTTGEGVFQGYAAAAGSTASLARAIGVNSSAVDTTSSQALVLSVTLPTSNSLCEIVLKAAAAWLA